MALKSIEQARFCHVGRVMPDPGWQMRSHSHSFHELVCVVRGRLWVRGGGLELEVGAGDVLLYPAGVAHAEWTSRQEPVESLFVGFTAATSARSSILAARDVQGRMGEMLRWLQEDANAHGAPVRRERRALLMAVLDEFQRALDGSPVSELVRRVRRHVQGRLAAPLTLAELARVAGLSRWHFVRAYRRAAGRTPMADVRAMRVQYARQLILGSALPLKEVARLAGLGNEYAMSRTFRRCLDMPPGQLRRFRNEAPRPARAGRGNATSA